eukprot:scaffold119375_cov59-Phaeocystis_antarctica.AAC.1
MTAQLPALQWYVWSPRHEDFRTSAPWRAATHRPSSKVLVLISVPPHCHPRSLHSRSSGSCE